MQALIVVGDRTSHGGVVIDGSPETDINGKAVARVGNHATCPVRGYGRITTIVTGDPTLIIDGAPAACHGDKTACGAVLLSSQATTFDEWGSGAASAQHASSAGSRSSPSVSAAAYDMHFIVREQGTGRPLAGVPYRISLEDGREVTGITDPTGLTSKVTAGTPLAATVEAPFYGDSSYNPDAGSGHDACGC